uniref:Uncharacterized protein n=1 Tax=Romanomermis culicivorax TaxID=13658 RepID=A0A915IBS0_ROMCU
MKKACSRYEMLWKRHMLQIKCKFGKYKIGRVENLHCVFDVSKELCWC